MYSTKLLGALEPVGILLAFIYLPWPAEGFLLLLWLLLLLIILTTFYALTILIASQTRGKGQILDELLVMLIFQLD